jgi:uncharacterized protein CbrC (UPF0167 family)
MGRKLIARGHFLDNNIPRAQVAEELLSLARTYEALKAEFQRLWLADCKDAGSFRGYVQRFDNTIVPCRKKAQELARVPPAQVAADVSWRILTEAKTAPTAGRVAQLSNIRNIMNKMH